MDEKDLYSPYVGGDVVPADLWGAAPDRGKAIQLVEDILKGHMSINPVVIVDTLINAGLIVDETNPKDRMHRRLQALRQEARLITCTIEHEMAELRKLAAAEGWLKS